MKINCEKSEKSEILLLYLENKMIWFDGNSDSWRLTSLGKKNCVNFMYSGFYKDIPDRCRLRELKPKCCDKIPAEDEEFAENHQKPASITQGYPTM